MAKARKLLETLSARIVGESEGEKDTYRIGDLAREFDLSLRTLRFYEDRGLLSPRRVGSTRLYDPSERERLKVILFAKGLGFALSGIEEILEVYDRCDDTGADIALLSERFEEQSKLLNGQLEEVKHSIGDLQQAMTFLHENATVG